MSSKNQNIPEKLVCPKCGEDIRINGFCDYSCVSYIYDSEKDEFKVKDIDYDPGQHLVCLNCYAELPYEIEQNIKVNREIGVSKRTIRYGNIVIEETVI